MTQEDAIQHIYSAANHIRIASKFLHDVLYKPDIERSDTNPHIYTENEKGAIRQAIYFVSREDIAELTKLIAEINFM